MPSPYRAGPANALALTIIRHAVKAWKKNRFLISGIRELDHALGGNAKLPHWLQSEHDGLLAFFHSEWFNFLFMSSVTRTDQGRMFKALGIPAREGG